VIKVLRQLLGRATVFEAMDFKAYFQSRNLTKIPKVGIHFEQKTTPDLIWCVALVVSELIKANPNNTFTDQDVRSASLFNELMRDYFSKPPQEPGAENEYNKVSSYQLGLLVYAGVLECISTGPKTYQVANPEVLAFLSVNDRNASKFLTEYTEKLLRDNGLWSSFEDYLNRPTQENYFRCKDAYWAWAKTYTAVQGSNPQHSYRVYNKIFNLMCYKYQVPGQSGSKVEEGPCPYNYLIYNRKNFRDEDKPTGMTRQEYQQTVLNQIDDEGVVATAITKAKDAVRRKYGQSELTESEYWYETDAGVQVHHMLMASAYPKFSVTRENLIALTPGQHTSRAHPQSNFQRVDPWFQAVCLRRKLQNIDKSLAAGEDFYHYPNFIDVVNACYDWELPASTPSAQIMTLLDQKVEALHK
jgi:hypothetical protein